MAELYNEVLQEENDYANKYGFSDKLLYEEMQKGLSEDIVRFISKTKNEPEWMLNKRLLGYKMFEEKPTPKWGPDLSKLNYDEIYYYKKPKNSKNVDNWDQVPDDIKKTFDKLGVPEAERKFFAGGAAQYDSEVVYHHLQQDLEAKGVIFTDMDTAVKKYPDLVKKYFGSVIPPTDNKFAALNTATWSGGSFIYVPKGVKLAMPLQAYFRINAESSGQFERTLIIADEGADVTYIEGCTAPIYIASALHAAVVELVAHKDAHIRYVTVQNWSKNVYNLVTQRATAGENGHVEWIDANIGSQANMKYPSIYLNGEGAKGEILSIAVAGKDQIQDTGGKVFHLAPNTTSKIISKSITKGNGLTTYRGLVHIDKRALHSKSTVKCDALLLDENSKTNTYPYNEIYADDAFISHEATVGRLGEDELFYLMSRGLSEDDAIATAVLGFIQPLVDVLPLEYSLELKRLIKMDTSNSIG